MASPTLAFIGGGNMAGAIFGGLLRGGWPAAAITVVEPLAEQREHIAAAHPGLRVLAAAEASLAAAEIVVWAVKPQSFAEAAAPCAGFVGRALQLSVMAGIPSQAIVRASGSARVVRAMPNTPALVGEGATAIAPAAGCAAATLAWARGLMESVGRVVEVDERLMDAVTGVSGSGPAYVYMLAEALIDAAVAEGLAPRDADALVRQLLVGAAALWARDDSSPATLRQRVTSPNGTTAAAVAELDRSGFREIVARAVRAATARSRELGDTKP